MPECDGTADFALHPALARDALFIDKWSVCQLLLMNDSRYPWLILVPERVGLRDLDDLTIEESRGVWDDMALASRLLRTLYQPDKINVAALGNMVPQLHIHVIARFRGDDAWPHPVWGQHPSRPYAETDLQVLRNKITLFAGRIC
ncbi:MAG: HIT family protein [Magnetococcales bacterium]|nr:HIT family protein [Magnetococcales bacterium]